MNWTSFGTGLSSILIVVLVIRLIKLHLHHVYRIFSFFLLYQVVADWAYLVLLYLNRYVYVDYRVLWLATRLTEWVLEIWIVFALLQAILTNFPGLLRLSRRLVGFGIPGIVVLVLLSARPEYLASGASAYAELLPRVIGIAYVIQRVVAMAALMALLLILFFIFWFPVQIPRNLAVFSVGFVFYFTVKTSLLVVHSYWTQSNTSLLDHGENVVFCTCLIYWLLFINRVGESVPVVIGHRWQAEEQVRLLGHLESLNAALVRSAGRQPSHTP